MDQAYVKDKLIEVLEAIQCDSGYVLVAMVGSTCPLTDLEGFDSKIWPVAISQLAKSIGVSIPNRKNIFVSTNGRQRLTIDQIAVEVCKLVPNGA